MDRSPTKSVWWGFKTSFSANYGTRISQWNYELSVTFIREICMPLTMDEYAYLRMATEHAQGWSCWSVKELMPTLRYRCRSMACRFCFWLYEIYATNAEGMVEVMKLK